MSITLRYVLASVAFWVLFASCDVSGASNEAQLRRLKVSDKMPEFVLPDSNGVSFAYKRGIGSMLAVAFLSPNQRQSEQAAADLQKILSEVEADNCPLEFVIITDEPNAQKHFAFLCKKLRMKAHVLLDNEYGLWGQIGVIATPTLIITDKDGVVKWFKAGYGYDFAPLAKSHLCGSSYISDSNSANEMISAQTLKNDSLQAKVQRHLQIANILEKKGQLDSAIAEARKAQQLDPNSIEAAMRLGRLYCMSGDGKAAVQAVSAVKAQTKTQEAEANLILGWAYREIGDLDAAFKALLNATSLDQNSSRGFYELGKIYQIRRDNEKAMDAYRKALEIVFSESVHPDFSHQ